MGEFHQQSAIFHAFCLLGDGIAVLIICNDIVFLQLVERYCFLLAICHMQCQFCLTQIQRHIKFRSQSRFYLKFHPCDLLVFLIQTILFCLCQSVFHGAEMAFCRFCGTADRVKSIAFFLCQRFGKTGQIRQTYGFFQDIFPACVKVFGIICILDGFRTSDDAVFYCHFHHVGTSVRVIASPCGCTVPFTVSDFPFWLCRLCLIGEIKEQTYITAIGIVFCVVGECQFQRFAVNGFFHRIVRKCFPCGIRYLNGEGVFFPFLIYFWHLYIIEGIHAFGVFPFLTGNGDGLDGFSCFGGQFDFCRNLFFVINDLHIEGLCHTIILNLDGLCSLLGIFFGEDIILIGFCCKAFCFAGIPAFFSLFAAFFRYQIDIQQTQIQLVSHAIYGLEQFCIQRKGCHGRIVCLVVDGNIVGIVFPSCKAFTGRNFPKERFPVVIFLMINSLCQQAVIVINLDILDLAFGFDAVIEFVFIQLHLLCFAIGKCNHQMGGRFSHGLFGGHHFGRHHNQAIILAELYLQGTILVDTRCIFRNDRTIFNIGGNAIFGNLVKGYGFCLSIRKMHFQHSTGQIQLFTKVHVSLGLFLKIEPLHILFHLIGTVFFRTKDSVFQCAQVAFGCFRSTGYRVVSRPCFLAKLRFQLVHIFCISNALYMVQHILSSFKTFVLNVLFAVCRKNLSIFHNNADNVWPFRLVIQAVCTSAIPYAIRQNTALLFLGRTTGTAGGMFLLSHGKFFFRAFLVCGHSGFGLNFFSASLHAVNIVPSGDFCIFRKNLHLVSAGMDFAYTACTADLGSFGLGFHLGYRSIFFHLDFGVFRTRFHLHSADFPFFHRQGQRLGNLHFIKITR